MENKLLENEVLKTLSFLEPMSLEHIFLDMDEDFTQSHPHFTYEDLLSVLKDLKVQKKVKLIVKENQKLWIKLFPKKNWLKKWLNL